MSHIKSVIPLVKKEFPHLNDEVIREALEAVYNNNEGFDGEDDGSYLTQLTIKFIQQANSPHRLAAKIAQSKLHTNGIDSLTFHELAAINDFKDLANPDTMKRQEEMVREFHKTRGTGYGK